jgi:hypothetical protein
MEPCYILTYSVQGACAVNVNSVDSVEDKPMGRCQVNFQNGSRLLLDEACEAYHNKAPYCSTERPADIPVYG